MSGTVPPDAGTETSPPSAEFETGPRGAIVGFVPKTLAPADALVPFGGVLHTPAEITAIERLPGVGTLPFGDARALAAFSVLVAPPSAEGGAMRTRPSPVGYRGETGRVVGAAPGIYMLRSHLGQEKLGVELLRLFALGKFDSVVYAGAAPGTNIATIAAMVAAALGSAAPRWYLYDPAEFSPAALASPHCEVRTGPDGMFTDASADEWAARVAAGERVLLVSDIRSGSHTEADFELEVVSNMLMQQGWVERVRPALASLKFRLPYVVDPAAPPPPFRYLVGTVYAQAWAPTTSTEGRLLVEAPPPGKPYPVADYDSLAYERACFHQNLAREYAAFDVAGQRAAAAALPGLCSCLDCAVASSIAASAVRALRAAASRGAPADDPDGWREGARVLGAIFSATRHRLSSEVTGHGIATAPGMRIAGAHAGLAARYAASFARSRVRRAERRPITHAAPTTAQKQ